MSSPSTTQWAHSWLTAQPVDLAGQYELEFSWQLASERINTCKVEISEIKNANYMNDVCLVGIDGWGGRTPYEISVVFWLNSLGGT